jgi:hypothetical protein
MKIVNVNVKRYVKMYSGVGNMALMNNGNGEKTSKHKQM